MVSPSGAPRGRRAPDVSAQSCAVDAIPRGARLFECIVGVVALSRWMVARDGRALAAKEAVLRVKPANFAKISGHPQARSAELVAHERQSGGRRLPHQ